MELEHKELYERGVQLLNENKLDEAIAVFTEIIDFMGIGINHIVGKAKAPSYLGRGNAYMRKKNYPHAIADYGKAIELQADSTAYNNRGIAYKEQGDYVRAIADYDKAIELDPSNKSAIYNREIAMALQHTEEFKQELQKQLKAHQSDILDVEQYKEKAQEYNAEKSKMEEERDTRIRWLFILAIAFYGGAAVFWLFNKGEGLNPFHLFPFILLATLMLSPVVWSIRILNRNINKIWALRENAYTNSILTLLINTGSDKDSEVRKKLTAEYFDHHDKRGSAQLIMEGERGKKRDNDAIKLLQNVFHKKEE